MATISPTQDEVRGALREFMITLLPDDVDVVIGQENRTAEPRAGSFVVMTPIRFNRLSTNIDAYDDVVFTGSISGTVLTVTAVIRGTIKVGRNIYGTGVTAGSKITEMISASGGTGTYRVSASQTLSSRTIGAGAKTMTQGAEVTVQCDFHDAGSGVSADHAQIITTGFYDEYAYNQMAEQQDGHVVSPLYHSPPAQRPFINESSNYEWRWVVDLTMQVNQTVTVPMEFADTIEVTPVSVEAEWPPT